MIMERIDAFRAMLKSLVAALASTMKEIHGIRAVASGKPVTTSTSADHRPFLPVFEQSSSIDRNSLHDAQLDSENNYPQSVPVSSSTQTPSPPVGRRESPGEAHDQDWSVWSSRGEQNDDRHFKCTDSSPPTVHSC